MPFVSARRWLRFLFLASALFCVSGCDRSPTGQSEKPLANCIDTENLEKGAERGSIVALTNPPVRDPEQVDNLQDSDRVVALLAGDTPLAVPRKLLNQHEVVNLDHWLDTPITITHCPLTKSSLAFDRSAVDGAEFRVSGLLFHDNLVMIDERENDSLWPQMQRSALCGSASGTSLDMVPVLDLKWGHWRSLHPNTSVLPVTVNGNRVGAGGPERPAPSRRTESAAAPSGRVLGLPGASLGEDVPKAAARGGVAVPFQALNEGGAVRAVELSDEGPVVFWRRAAQAAMAFSSSASFSVTEEEHIVDDATGSVWTLDGRAIEGRRAGDQLPPVETAYVALWSAWSDFHSNTDVWSNDS